MGEQTVHRKETKMALNRRGSWGSTLHITLCRDDRLAQNARLNTCWQGCLEIGISVHGWWKCELASYWGSQGYKCTYFVTAVQFWGFILRHLCACRRLCTCKLIHCSIFFNSERLETTWMSLSRGLAMVHRYSGKLCSCRFLWKDELGTKIQNSTNIQVEKSNRFLPCVKGR